MFSCRFQLSLGRVIKRCIFLPATWWRHERWNDSGNNDFNEFTKKMIFNEKGFCFLEHLLPGIGLCRASHSPTRRALPHRQFSGRETPRQTVENCRGSQHFVLKCRSSGRKVPPPGRFQLWVQTEMGREAGVDQVPGHFRGQEDRSGWRQRSVHWRVLSTNHGLSWSMTEFKQAILTCHRT